MSPNSIVGMAIAALRESGVPLHVDAILRRVEAMKGEATNRASLVGSLARLTKESLHFYRSEESTYGLLVWKQIQGRKAGAAAKTHERPGLAARPNA